jgi:hypothetical protein
MLLPVFKQVLTHVTMDLPFNLGSNHDKRNQRCLRDMFASLMYQINVENMCYICDTTF